VSRLLLKSGELSEFAIQKEIIKWSNSILALRKLVIHIPNEGKRETITGKNLQSIGMIAGVADLFIPIARNGYHGIWIEVKSQKGHLSESQRIFLSRMEQQGYLTATVRSLEQFQDIVNRYLKTNSTNMPSSDTVSNI